MDPRAASASSRPHRRPHLAALLGVVLVAAVGACQLKIDEPDLGNLGNLEICDGMTLEELIDAQTLSDECKASVEGFLPQPSTNFAAKLVVLGSDEEEDGSLTVYAHGADASGNALQADAWEDVRVSVEVAGSPQLLAEGEFTVHWVADAPADLLSIGIVNDYSGSMGQSDLQTVAGMQTDLFHYLPPIYEAEVIQFSSEVVVKQTFTTDQNALLEAVAYDSGFKRELTALYDGMGHGLDSLLTRTRPLRLLIVSTDGQENDSNRYSRMQIIDTVTREKVPVLMLGALFADPSELRDLAGPRGVYFYTPYYQDARAQIEQYLESLANLVAINIPAENRGDGPVTVEAEGVGAGL